MKHEYNIQDKCDVLDAWKQYRQFEGFCYHEKKNIFSKEEDGQEKPPTADWAAAASLVEEFEKRAQAARSAGCVYSDLVFAFKLMELYAGLEMMDIHRFLESVGSVREGTGLYRLVKAYINNLTVLNDELESFDSSKESFTLEEDFDEDQKPLLNLEASLVDIKGIECHNDDFATSFTTKEDTINIDLEELAEALRTQKLKRKGDDAAKNLKRLKTRAKKTSKDGSADDSNLPEEDSATKKQSPCNQCSYQANTEREFVHHVQVAHGYAEHQCKQCCQTFATRQNLIRHQKAVHEGVRHPCDDCSQVFTTRYSLCEHKRSIHEGVRHSCTQCNLKFSTRHNLVRHINSVHKGITFVCEVCGIAFSSQHKVSQHKTLKHEKVNDEKNLDCTDCHRSFSSLLSLRDHSRRVHGVRHPCDQCGKVLHSVRYLKLHKRIIHDGIRLPCADCGRQFRLEAHLKRHRRVAHSEEPLDESQVCDKCGRRMKNKQALNQHKRKVHDFRQYYACTQCEYAGKDTVELKAHVTLKHEGKKLPCDQCEYMATSLIGLYQHRAAHKERPKCDECGIEFKSKRWLPIHKQIKHGQGDYQCTVCHAKLATKLTLKTHMMKLHGDPEDLMRCGDGSCSYVTYSRTLLVHHRRRVHDKLLRVKCERCDFVAADATKLKIHVLSKHEGKKFSCDQCDYEASTPNYLRHHKNVTHFNKRFKCEQCDFVTKQKHRLKLHSQAKHDGIRFPCTVCDMTFSSQSSLRKHLKSKHQPALDPQLAPTMSLVSKD